MTKKSDSKKKALQFTTSTYTEVGAFEMSRFIEQTYGHYFDIIASEEWGNDSDHAFTFNKNEDLGEYEQKKLKKFKSGKNQDGYMARTIMQDMVNNEVLAPGNYLISVCW